MKAGKRYAVFSIRPTAPKSESTWTRAGSAWLNRDGSVNVYLDVLPIDGKLHIRELSDAPSNALKAVDLKETLPSNENLRKIAGASETSAALERIKNALDALDTGAAQTSAEFVRALRSVRDDVTSRIDSIVDSGVNMDE